MKERKVHLTLKQKLEIGLEEFRPEFQTYPDETIEFCEYNKLCEDVCLKSKQENCQVAKFYVKYPNYNKLFIGSKI